MKNKIKTLLIVLLIASMYAGFAQQVTHLGNSQRHSRYAQYGPEAATQLWETELTSAFLSMPTWYYENMAIYSRIYSFDDSAKDYSVNTLQEAEDLLKGSDGIQELICLDIHTGALIWETNHGLNLVILGIQNGLIITMEYSGGVGSQQVYVLDITDGSISSQLPFLTESSTMQGIAFTNETNGDFILPGPGSNTSRINNETGEIMWQLPSMWGVTGNAFVTLNKYYKTGYTWYGFFGQYQDLVAFDVATGEELYRRTLPNNAVQQNDILTGPDNSIFVQPRDFPGLTRYKDTGYGIDSLWCTPDVIINFGLNMVLNKDNSILAQKDNKIIKIDFETGEILDESSQGYSMTRFMGVDLSGKIYIVHGEPSTATCLDEELNMLYQIPLGTGAYYANAVPGPDGIMVLTSPTKAVAYQTDQSAILFPPNNFLASIDVNTNAVSLSWAASNPNTHNLQGYNVYKNGNIINGSVITNLFYNYDENTLEDYHYYVTAVYDQGESDASFYDFISVKELVANIEGTVSVLASGNGLQGAVVSIGYQSYTTEPDGTFGIYQIEPGVKELSVVASGYNTYLETITLQPGETITLEIEMTAPDLEYSLDDIQLQLLAGQHEDVTLSITNNGDGSAQWRARLFYDDFFKDAALAKGKGNDGSNDVIAVNHNFKKESLEFLDTEIQFSYDVTTPTGSTSIVGAETDGEYFYCTNFNKEAMYKFTLEGELIETFTVPGVPKLRDLAYDGTYFYGGSGGPSIYQMDFNNHTLVETITITSNTRSMAYDVEADGFWVNNWNTALKLYNRQGAILDSITLPAGFNAHYGTAYDNMSEGGPYLWLFVTNEGNECHLEQYEIATGSPTGINYEISNIIGSTDPGGLFLAPNLIPNTITIGGIAQSNPDILFGINAGVMNNWISPETFEAVIEAGETIDLLITIFAPENYAGENLKGSIVFTPQPAIGNHTVEVSLDVLSKLNDLEAGTIGVFPNPVNDVLHVRYQDISKVEVYNNMGVLMYQSITNQNELTIDVKGFPTGIYFIKTESGEVSKIDKIIRN